MDDRRDMSISESKGRRVRRRDLVRLPEALEGSEPRRFRCLWRDGHPETRRLATEISDALHEAGWTALESLSLAGPMRDRNTVEVEADNPDSVSSLMEWLKSCGFHPEFQQNERAEDVWIYIEPCQPGLESEAEGMTSERNAR